LSRIGKKPITIPEGVTVEINGDTVVVKSKTGELSQKIKGKIKVTTGDGKVLVESKEEGRSNKAMHGLYRSLIQNMVWGLSKGWNKGLELIGVGYRAAVSGNKLVLNVGFSHPVEFELPTGIKAVVTESKVNISGFDKQMVGEVAAKIRKIRPPEPYKGKGIRYIGEIVRRKAGKAAKAVGGAGGAK
jgi:large subunit ribosomal protein L6